MVDMKKTITAIIMLSLFSCFLYAQEDSLNTDEPHKFALVIGNSAYSGLGKLSNPVNDANGVASALWKLGFNIDILLNASLEEMEEATIRFKNNLGESKNSYGFFFYAGHGVQSGGENYLIPVNANIPSEGFLRSRALQVQAVLDDLNDAGNSLNVVVLDACRDNPFGWSRSSGRGLEVISRQPADSIIVYATSAGQTASDGEGDHGLFTNHLLKNLNVIDLEVYDLFRRTSNDVSLASDRKQIPAIYSQFFGTAYLGAAPSAPPPKPVQASPVPLPSKSKTEKSVNKEAQLWSLGASLASSFAAPWMIFTAHGTIAPFKYSFLELGFDFGLIEGNSGASYYSLYPFAHYAYFMPFNLISGKQDTKGGWYIGAGGGMLSVSYKMNEGEYHGNFFLASINAGVNFLNMIDISYTLRTNFSGISHKASVGYIYRFN